MKLFISWSGDTSHKAALLLKERLPDFLPGIQPWVSSHDIDKGARWSHEIAKQLDDCNFGIVCVDPSNAKSTWLHFEAGALSKSLQDGRVAPVLVGLTPSDVAGPLSQFQMTTVSESDVLRLLESINEAMGDEKLPVGALLKSFASQWEALSEELGKIPIPEASTPSAPNSLDEGDTKEPNKTDTAILKALAGRIVGGRQQLAPTDVVTGGLGISSASAQYQMRRLHEMGLINFDLNGYPRLTDEGLNFLGSRGLL